MSAFPKIKLTYFHFAARAEAARLAFYVGGVPFIDERVTLEQFGAMKENLPLGQLPILEVDGQVLTQSEAILRYAGRLGGLYPVNAPLAALKIDEVISALAEVAAQMSTSFREQDPAKKKALREELATATIPRYATLIEARLEQLKKHSVFDTTQLFIHEISLYTWAKWLRSGVLDHIPTTILDGYTLINAAADKVSENTKVKEWYSMPHAMPKLKLTNLALPDRGEPARLALFIGDVPFEHERISNEELAKRKPSLPFNQLPVLEVDGEVISQSLAILRYAGSLAGLYQTNDPLEAYKIDEVFALVDDMYNSWRPAFQEKDPIKQLELLKRLAETTIPTILGFLEKRVGAWDGQYATGSRLTVADLVIYFLVFGLKSGRLQGVPTTVTESFKRLEQVHDKVKAHPKVVEWYEKNPPPVIP